MNDDSASRAIQVLIVEANAEDALLLTSLLTEKQPGRFHIDQVGQLSSAVERLNQGGIDVVLLDLSLPDSYGLDSFVRLQASFPSIPVVLMTGIEDETLALEAVKKGAQDYLVKGDMDARLLARAIPYAIERQKLLIHLESILYETKVLRGLLPICANCKKIRDDKGYWTRIETYIKEHSEADFTHSICPECVRKLYPQLRKQGGTSI